MRISLESDQVAFLLEQITRRTGETNLDAVTRALEERLRELEIKDRATLTLTWLQTVVWPNLAEAQRGSAPTKHEQEELLGF